MLRDALLQQRFCLNVWVGIVDDYLWSPNWSIHIRGLSMWSPLSRFLWRNNSPFIGGWTCHCSRWSLTSPRHFLYPLLTLNVQDVDEPFYLHINYPWRSGLLASKFSFPERNGDAAKKIFILCSPSWRRLGQIPVAVRGTGSKPVRLIRVRQYIRYRSGACVLVGGRARRASSWRRKQNCVPVHITRSDMCVERIVKVKLRSYYNIIHFDL
jgi:hypothetical protein